MELGWLQRYAGLAVDIDRVGTDNISFIVFHLEWYCYCRGDGAVLNQVIIVLTLGDTSLI